jgi:hypothetical protein
MYSEISVAQLYITEVSQPWQRGSLQSSHAKTAFDALYLVTIVLM